MVEQASALGAVGAGIQVTPNGMRVLDALGLGAQARARSIRAEAVEAMDALTGRRLTRMDLGGSDLWRLFTREALVDVLAGAAERAGARIALGRQADACNPTPDGLGGPALVVGADGIRSVVRTAIDGPAPATFTGQSAWRALVAWDQPPVARVWMAPGRHVVTYPVGPGLLNLVAVKEEEAWRDESWSREDEPANLRAAFADAAPPLAAILGAVTRTARWGLFRRPVARRWHESGADGARAILGDAAHPTLPFLGQGANLALEDAWVLAREAVAGRLDRYEALRRPRALRAVAAADANARSYHLGGAARVAAHLGLRALDRLAPGAMMRRLGWLYGFDATA